MPLRFYRRFRAGPFRMNLSKAGVSYSVGRKGAWLTMGHDRVRASVGIPGTGLGWYEQRRLRAQSVSRDIAQSTTRVGEPTLRNVRTLRSVRSAPSWRPLGWIVIALVIGALCVVLAGCSKEDAHDALGTCRRQVEQIVLLRQLALPPQKKAEVERCLADSNLPPEYCRAVYLDEDDAVRSCMSDKGYSFAPIHSLIDHVKADCYMATWLMKIEFLVRTPTNQMTAPAIGPCQF